MNYSIIDRIRFHAWRLVIIALMLSWTYYRFQVIDNNTERLIKIGIDIIIIGLISHRLYTSRFQWRTPRQFLNSLWDGENRLARVTLWILPWIFVVALVFGAAYKFHFNTEVKVILMGFLLLIMLLSALTAYMNFCLIKKDEQKEA